MSEQRTAYPRIGTSCAYCGESILLDENSTEIGWYHLKSGNVECALPALPAPPLCGFCDHPTAYFPATLEQGKWIHRGRDNEAEVCTAALHRCASCKEEKTSPECPFCGFTATPPLPTEAPTPLARIVRKYLDAEWCGVLNEGQRAHIAKEIEFQYELDKLVLHCRAIAPSESDRPSCEICYDTAELPIDGTLDAVYLEDDGVEYEYLSLLIPTVTVPCVCSPLWSLNSDLSMRAADVAAIAPRCRMRMPIITNDSHFLERF